MTLTDDPQRYMAANELHARPFPSLSAPGRAAFLALRPEGGPEARDREAERAHLIALLDRFGAAHPPPGATHYSGRIGRHMLKWESHTEFVTYTVFGDGVAERPFDAATFGIFPKDWLAAAPGVRITSALIRVEVAEGDEGLAEKARDWFEGESLAIARVLEDDLVAATDFRIDPAGHVRIALFARPGTGARRVGRVMQRLCEIETYKTMAMLGLLKARALAPDLSRIEDRLQAMARDMKGPDHAPAELLDGLLDVSAELEAVAARSSYRFAATQAYEAIVNQRIAVLREARFEGRQTFAEFMTRRFDPAMRTVASTKARLGEMTARALRAGDLLRTRVEVERSAQNQELLQSMDRRADLQLKLQRTVEGLSVVAISYYAVGLVVYALTPLATAMGVEKPWLAALAVPVVLVVVWGGLRRVQRGLH